MPSHPYNRPHKVDAATGEFLFMLYKLMFDAKVDPRIKQRTFESAADSKNSWRVVSISQAAIDHIKETTHTKGLRRGYMLPRVSRARYLFDRTEQLTKAEHLEYFFKHDTVAMVTRAENSIEGISHWSVLSAVPEGLFTADTFSINLRKSKEIPWINSLSRA